MISAAAALMLALPALAAAQDAPRGMGRGMPRMTTIAWLLESKAEFAATTEQVAKIDTISKKFEAETAQLRADMQKVRDENMGGDRQAMMEKMRPLRDELRKKDEAAVAEVLKLLSAEQQKTVNAMLAKRREEMRAGRMRN
jgi:hypothetical protein